MLKWANLPGGRYNSGINDVIPKKIDFFEKILLDIVDGIEYNEGKHTVARTWWCLFGFDSTVSRKRSPFVLTVYCTTISKCKATTSRRRRLFLMFVKED